MSLAVAIGLICLDSLGLSFLCVSLNDILLYSFILV